MSLSTFRLGLSLNDILADGYGRPVRHEERVAARARAGREPRLQREQDPGAVVLSGGLDRDDGRERCAVRAGRRRVLDLCDHARPCGVRLRLVLRDIEDG